MLCQIYEFSDTSGQMLIFFSKRKIQKNILYLIGQSFPFFSKVGSECLFQKKNTSSGSMFSSRHLQGNGFPFITSIILLCFSLENYGEFENEAKEAIFDEEEAHVVITTTHNEILETPVEEQILVEEEEEEPEFDFSIL